MNSDLDDRIAAAFSADVKSDDVASLIRETEAEAIAAADAAECGRTAALDPTLSASDVTTARSEMDDAAFRRDRLQVAATKLGGRLREVKAQEENHRRRLAYDKRKAERDQLAAELERLYPPVAAQLADLIGRIAASDREIEYINRHALPNGAKPLMGAELVARGMRGFVNNSVEAPRITKQLRLPAFRPDQHDPYVWPRRR